MVVLVVYVSWAFSMLMRCVCSVNVTVGDGGGVTDVAGDVSDDTVVCVEYCVCCW